MAEVLSQIDSFFGKYRKSWEINLRGNHSFCSSISTLPSLPCHYIVGRIYFDYLRGELRTGCSALWIDSTCTVDNYNAKVIIIKRNVNEVVENARYTHSYYYITTAARRCYRMVFHFQNFIQTFNNKKMLTYTMICVRKSSRIVDKWAGADCFKAVQLTSIISCVHKLSLIHIWRCRRSTLCRSRWSPYH